MPATTGTSASLLFTLLVLLSFGTFIVMMRRRIVIMLASAPDDRFDHFLERLRGLAVYFIGQRRILDRRHLAAGIMHALIFWGFLAVLLNSVHLIVRAWVPDFHVPGFGPEGLLGAPYIALRDAFELIVLIMVLVAGFRRAVLRPARITRSGDATLVLWLIGVLMASDFVLNGSLVAAGLPTGEAYSLAAAITATAMTGFGTATLGTLHIAAWWVHMGALLFFLPYLTFSKHFHVVTALFNVWFRDLKPSALPFMDLEDESLEHYGTSSIEHLRWSDQLNLYTCVECGRCQDACPAYASGKPLSPKALNEDMRHHLYEKTDWLVSAFEGDGSGGDWEGPPLVGEIIKDETLWSCTTCRACEDACPLFISFVDRIVGMRRSLVLEESRFPNELADVFRNMETRGNPWGRAAADREVWTEGLDVPRMRDQEEVEYVVFVGCAGSFDAQAQRSLKSLVRILNAAGVSYAILGKEETCTGDPARRAGNEYLFQMMAAQNVETLNAHRFKKVVTSCPHCYNTIRNEYPQLGGEYEVVHHSELIAELIQKGRLPLKNGHHETVTFHDSCYLGRHNDIYDAPRDALQAIPGITVEEMPRSRNDGFCCGAGGARMWLDEDKPRVNTLRVDEAAETTNASVVCTACPFCAVMIGDGIKETRREETLRTADFAELVARALVVQDTGVPSQGSPSPASSPPASPSRITPSPGTPSISDNETTAS